MPTVPQLHAGCRLPASPVTVHNIVHGPTSVVRPASLPTSHTSWFYHDQSHFACVHGFYPPSCGPTIFQHQWHRCGPPSRRHAAPRLVALALFPPPTLRCCNARIHTPTGPIPPLQAPSSLNLWPWVGKFGRWLPLP